MPGMDKQRGFKFNARANAKVTEQDTVFLNIKPNTQVRGRILPPQTSDGVIIFKESKHFKLKNEENKNTACTCQLSHKDEPCFVCAVSKLLSKSKDKAEAQIGKDLCASHKYHVPFLLAEPTGEMDTKGKPVWEYQQKVRLLSLNYTTAETILMPTIMSAIQAGDDPMMDVDNGQDIVIARTGAGFDTKYTINTVGLKTSLDSIFPEWETKFLEEFDIAEAITFNFLTNEEQIAACMRAFPSELDWAEIEAKLGG